MTLTLGPVLYFRGTRGRSWRLSALVGTAAGDEPAPLETEGDRVPPHRLAERRGRGLWRYDFALPLAERESGHDYRIGRQSWRVHLPGARSALHLAYTACNGSEKGNTWDDGKTRNERWLHLAARHAEHPFHLLLQGGDQLYADPIWREVPALAEWKKMTPWRRRRACFAPETAEAVADDYFDRYWELWRQPELAAILATLPSLMMWDDHDIFDGWGSWSAGWQRCPTFQGIWAAAREHFALFQLAARRDDLPEGFSDRRGRHFAWAYRIGEVGLVAPDLRSERSRERVLGDTGRHAFAAALASMTDCRQVLLVSSMPLVNPHLTLLEHGFNVMPGHQTWQDDLVDQWPSAAHWSEWQDLLRTLVDFSARTGVRVTSLSGEIHLGALGVIQSGATEIYQLTSSGIVHPPPSPAVTTALEWIGARTTRLAPDLTVRLLPLPGSGRRFLRARNWLELELPGGDALTATWHSEGPTPASRLAIGQRANDPRPGSWLPPVAARCQPGRRSPDQVIGTPVRRSS
jgi:PhoD related phosphatase